MSLETREKSKTVTDLLNASIASIKSVVMFDFQLGAIQLLPNSFNLHYGVLIGIMGDINGKLVFGGDESTFGSIGEQMYGMPLQGEMLRSFSGELANMIAGGISTHLANNATEINITTPTILEGNTKLSGYKQGLELTIMFKEHGKMNAYLLMD